MTPKRLFIVDLMALAFRSFFAFARTPLTTKSGMPTAAVFGSAMFMNKLLTEEKPDYLMAAMESEEPTFRHQTFKDYKAHRDRMPQGLGEQLPYIFELFKHYGCPIVSSPGFEADDIIGSACKKFANPKLHIHIVSNDKDFTQLINNHVFMHTTKKNEVQETLNQQSVKERYECLPGQMRDFLALIGDSSDNVPGVRGIGEKGAAKLISTYGSLEEIYRNLDEVKPEKTKKALTEFKDEAFLSRELVTIDQDAPLSITLAELTCDATAAKANPDLLAFYEELEFRQLADKVRAVMASRGEATPASAVAAAEKTAVRYEVLCAAKPLADLIEKIKKAGRFAFAVQTTSNDIITETPVGLALSCQEGEAYYLPFAGSADGLLDFSAAKPVLSQLFADPKLLKIGHDIKFDWQVLKNAGISLNLPFVDTMVCDYLIDPNYNDHTLKNCLERHLHHRSPPAAKHSPFISHNEESYLSLAEDVDYTLRLYQLFDPRMRAQKLDRVLKDVEMPLLPVLAEMEQTGVHLDTEFLRKLSDDLARKAEELEQRIYGEAGVTFNINSTKQLQEVLFEKLKVHEQVGLKRLKKTKTGYSTDESVLVQLKDHPVPRDILEYRLVMKLKNTYVDPLPQYIHPKTGRLHARFRQTVAATGRLSSDNPNLQNIPLRSSLGQEIRKAFCPEDSSALMISADYSQIEVRLLAHLAQEEHLIAGFREGLDIHRLTAAKIFNLPLEKVSPEQRNQAKAINFGIIYGMGPQRLAQETGVSLTEAKEFIDKYNEVYAAIKKYTTGLIHRARTQGFTETIMGRRRPMIGLNDPNRAVSARAENIAVNAPIQGSAADLIKLAMINIHHDLKKAGLKARMLLQIHDELLFECPAAERQKTEEIVRHGMENALKTSVPLRVEIGAGSNWLEAH